MAVSDETRQRVLENFPAFAYLLDIEEIASLLQRAVDQEWTADTFEANLRATQWWRTQSDAVRSRRTMEMTDPASATAQVNALKDRIKNAARTIGAEMDDERAGAFAWGAWRGAWSEQQLRQNIVAELSPSQGSMVSVRALARQYMVDLDDATAMNLTKRVFAGELDQGAVEQLLADQAMSRFPTLAEYIKKGVRPAEFFSPYRQMIAEYTGANPETIDLAKDPTWSRVVSYADGTALRPMTMDEAMRYVRSTQQFANSARGQAEQASFVKMFAQTVGAMGRG